MTSEAQLLAAGMPDACASVLPTGAAFSAAAGVAHIVVQQLVDYIVKGSLVIPDPRGSGTNTGSVFDHSSSLTVGLAAHHRVMNQSNEHPTASPNPPPSPPPLPGFYSHLLPSLVGRLMSTDGDDRNEGLVSSLSAPIAAPCSVGSAAMVGAAAGSVPVPPSSRSTRKKDLKFSKSAGVVRPDSSSGGGGGVKAVVSTSNNTLSACASAVGGGGAMIGERLFSSVTGPAAKVEAERRVEGVDSDSLSRVAAHRHCTIEDSLWLLAKAKRGEMRDREREGEK